MSGTRRPKGNTAFGSVLEQLRMKYIFHNQDLTSTGLLTRTEVDQLSRMSSRSEAVLAMNAERRDQFIVKVARAIVYLLGARPEALSALPHLEGQIQKKLTDSINADLLSAKKQPLMIWVAEQLVEMTGRSVFQLESDLNEADSVDDLYRLWRSPEGA